MNELERKILLQRSAEFFKNNIAANHLEKTKNLSLADFNVNPFLDKYIAKFTFGKSDPKTMAKALIYPRIMGTSISTTFGTQIQQFCNEVLDSYASVVQGIDIEFIDATDGRKKYCQLKSGPQTINKDDVKTIKDHFKTIKNQARTNKLDLQVSDCIVGVLYGKADSLNASYNKINIDYPVYAGQEFWYRLTGDKDFYDDLINTFAKVADTIDASKTVNNLINKISKELENKND